MNLKKRAAGAIAVAMSVVVMTSVVKCCTQRIIKQVWHHRQQRRT